MGRVLVGAAILIGVLAQAFLHGIALGLNLVLLVGAVLAAGDGLRRQGARLDRADLWIPTAALAFAAFVAVRSDPVLVAFDAFVAVGLALAAVAAIGGAALTRRSLLGLGSVAVGVLGLVLLGGREPIVAARPAAGSSAIRERLGRLIPLARGLLIAGPLLLVFAALFAAADAVFARAVSDLLAIDISLGDLPARLALAAAVTWMTSGLLVAVAREVFPPEPRSVGAAASAPALALSRIGLTEAVVILAVLDLLFAVFVALQFRYLFGGGDTLAASGMTYSEYARRGFFELIAVGFLAGVLIAGLEATIAGRSRTYLFAAVALAGLTLVVLVSAALRLKLYQDAYGWTELRFYAYAAIAWLGLGAFVMIGLLAAGRMRWLGHALGILALAVALAVNAVGPQDFVASQNLARVIDPRLVAPGGEAALDAWYLASLGDDAVPAMVEALRYVPLHDRGLLEQELRRRELALSRPENTAWPAWNLARDRARSALAGAGVGR